MIDGTDIWVITSHLEFEGMLGILGVRTSRAEAEARMLQAARSIDPSKEHKVTEHPDGSLGIAVGDRHLSAESHRLP